MEVGPPDITTDRPLAAYWDDEIPVWSPDGKWLAFGIKGHVHLVAARRRLAEKNHRLYLLPRVVHASCPIHTDLIVTVERNDTDQLLLTDIDGSWPRALTTDTIGDHWDARPSPDGKIHRLHPAPLR